MTPRFADAMALRPGQVEDGTMDFEADLGADWTIGPKVHGGVMVALCAKAARTGYRSAMPGADGVHPVGVSANFLSAPDPGPVRLRTAVRKRGRRIGLVDVELMQGQRACVHAVVTLGVLEHDAVPLYSDGRVAAMMAVQPPAGIVPIGPGHPGAEINHLTRGCDIRPDVTQEADDGPGPQFRIWVRPRDGVVDELFALMCGDISLPVPYAVGRRGWAPTVQLTAYLRGLPVDGWLRVLCTTSQIGQDWFDEDHVVVDSSGRIVVQTRQLALVPTG